MREMISMADTDNVHEHTFDMVENEQPDGVWMACSQCGERATSKIPLGAVPAVSEDAAADAEPEADAAADPA